MFQSFNVQAGMDVTGVPTDMLNLNSTVRVFYRNPATFFGVHVTSTPIEIHYYQLMVATGYVSLFSFSIINLYYTYKSVFNVYLVCICCSNFYSQKSQVESRGRRPHFFEIRSLKLIKLNL